MMMFFKMCFIIFDKRDKGIGFVTLHHFKSYKDCIKNFFPHIRRVFFEIRIGFFFMSIYLKIHLLGVSNFQNNGRISQQNILKITFE